MEGARGKEAYNYYHLSCKPTFLGAKECLGCQQEIYWDQSSLEKIPALNIDAFSMS